MAYVSHFRAQTLALALAAPLLISAGSPAGVGVQIVNQSGLPVYQAVVEIARPAGNTAALAFGWRNAMAQRNLAFAPGTLIVPAGSAVSFPNLDNVRHSIFSFSKAQKFQIDLYGRDQSRTQAFPVAGTVALGCNIHDSMRGYIRVTKTPFAAVTGADGRTRIQGLGAGTYRVTVWHPQLRGAANEQVQTVTVRAGEPLRLVIATR